MCNTGGGGVAGCGEGCSGAAAVSGSAGEMSHVGELAVLVCM